MLLKKLSKQFLTSKNTRPGAEAEVEAEAGADFEAKAEHAAEAEERAKVVFVARVEREAKAGLTVGAGAGARRITFGARAEPGGQGHEVVVRGAMAKTKKERGARALSPGVVAAAAVVVSKGIDC